MNNIIVWYETGLVESYRKLVFKDLDTHAFLEINLSSLANGHYPSAYLDDKTIETLIYFLKKEEKPRLCRLISKIGQWMGFVDNNKGVNK